VLDVAVAAFGLGEMLGFPGCTTTFFISDPLGKTDQVSTSTFIQAARFRNFTEFRSPYFKHSPL
jgi:hypothetical protein